VEAICRDFPGDVRAFRGAFSAPVQDRRSGGTSVLRLKGAARLRRWCRPITRFRGNGHLTGAGLQFDPVWLEGRSLLWPSKLTEVANGAHA